MPEKNQTENEADALYSVAASNAIEDDTGAYSKLFFTDDLLALGGYTENSQIFPLIQTLSKQCLFRTIKQNGQTGWSVRPREAARQICTLDKDEREIYGAIEESHINGIWKKDIRRKTNAAETVVTKALNKLEKARLIKSIQNVKSRYQKTYILAHLKPSEDVTGNSFYDAGDLDESFRDELLNLIIFWVRQQSWKDRKEKHHKIKKEPKSPVLVADDKDDGTKKRKRTADIEELGSRAVKHRSARFDPETDTCAQVIYKAGTHNYPTAEDIHTYLVNSPAILETKKKSLTVPEIQTCLDVLRWDEKLEKVPTRDGQWGYRTVRGVSFRPPGTLGGDWEELPGTALTQTPCGRCPVYDVCHEGGPVNPQECEYFDKWLRV